MNANTQRTFYSGKKKQHTVKYELVWDLATELFSWVNGPFPGDLADRGEPSFFTPIKRERGQSLGELAQVFNRLLGAERVEVERAIRRLKVFNCLHTTWRHSLEFHSSCFTLIVCIVNIDLCFFPLTRK
ncbi:DDE Tnp4 domain-containing protein [Balamuthia mandrillaris]